MSEASGDRVSPGAGRVVLAIGIAIVLGGLVVLATRVVDVGVVAVIFGAVLTAAGFGIVRAADRPPAA